MAQTTRKEIVDSIAGDLPHLLRYARALTRNAAEADDLVQECLARALARTHLYQPGTNLRGWLMTILRNLHISEARRRKRRGTTVGIEDHDRRLSVPPTQDDGLMVRAVVAAIARLPDDQSDALMLIGVEQLSYEDAAERLDMPVGTVKSRVSRGRAALRSRLESSAWAQAA